MRTYHYCIEASKQESRLHPWTKGMEHCLLSKRLIGWLQAKSYEDAGRQIEAIAHDCYPTFEGWDWQIHWLPREERRISLRAPAPEQPVSQADPQDDWLMEG